MEHSDSFSGFVDNTQTVNSQCNELTVSVYVNAWTAERTRIELTHASLSPGEYSFMTLDIWPSDVWQVTLWRLTPIYNVWNTMNLDCAAKQSLNVTRIWITMVIDWCRLLDMCKSADFHIVNGRVGSDAHIGLCTSTCVSTVDYVGASPIMFSHILQFYILGFDPLLIDIHQHLPPRR
jgi:hypothetical protein